MGEWPGVDEQRAEAAALLKAVKDDQRKLRGQLNEGLAEAFALFVTVVLARIVTGNRAEQTPPLVFAGIGAGFVLYAGWIASKFRARRDYGLGADRRFLVALGATGAAAVLAGVALEGSGFTVASGAILLIASLTLGRVLRQPTLVALGGMMGLQMIVGQSSWGSGAVLASPIVWVLLVKWPLRRLFEA